MAKKNSSSRGAQGAGAIRKKTVTRSGKVYTYWEARITTGRDPGTGRQIQRSISGKTQKEVRQKLQALAVAVDAGTYTPPSKLTVGEWLDTWAADYLNGRKPNTIRLYNIYLSNKIKPALGAVRLADLRPHDVQHFVNCLTDLAASSVRIVHVILHMALEKAVALGYIPRNPAAGCELPKKEQKEIKPLDDKQAAGLLKAATGTPLELLIPAALFTGMRLSELLGLTWNAVDTTAGTLSIDKQLARHNLREKSPFASPKNGKARTICPAGAVFRILTEQQKKQAEWRLKAGAVWSNPFNLVFTNEVGDPLEQSRVSYLFAKISTAAGLEGARFHDLRHTYAVNSIRAGDDIKTIQGNLGHASAAFTLDRYGHFTDRMKLDSAARMDSFISDVMNL